MAAITDELDISRAAVCAAGAVCRNERALRLALASLLADPRDPQSWSRVRECVQEEKEEALRRDLALLESVATSGGAGVGSGGSPRVPFYEEGPC